MERAEPPVKEAVAQWWPGIVAITGMMALLGVAPMFGLNFGPALLLAAVAAICIWCALSRPPWAAIALLLMIFLRLALESYFPVDPFWLALATLVVAMIWWLDRNPTLELRFGAVEGAMILYLLWNIWSAFRPHQYSAADEHSGTDFSVTRFILFAIFIPMVMYVTGRLAFRRESDVGALLWTLLLMAAYSAAVGIMQFHGAERWIWPRYEGEQSEADWGGRAAGVLHQPVANGVVLAIGVAIALQLASQGSTSRWQRIMASIIGVACGYGIYLTHTRAAWLSGVVVLVIGALIATGHRRPFLTALAIVAGTVMAKWSVFISSDRDAGGVGSVAELQDRLNTIETALWAAARQPIEGWGVGRFRTVNTVHHQQWSQDVPWVRGYGIVAHQSELGILAELGVVGLVLWLSVLGLIAYRLYSAYRVVPRTGLCNRPMVVTAVASLAVLVTTGLTVDLRFLDIPTAAVFLLVGVAVGRSEQKPCSDSVPVHLSKITASCPSSETELTSAPSFVTGS